MTTAKILSFPTPTPVGQASPELSGRLGHMRTGLGMSADSDDVFVAPAIEYYEPNFYPNGAVHLGKIGVEHFEATFGEVDVNPLRLYFDYFTLKKHIEQLRMLDVELHENLVEVAIDVKKWVPQFFSHKDPHQVESRIIGFVAANIAKKSAVNPDLNQREKSHASINVMSRAEKLVRSKKLAKSHGSVAIQTMTDFSLALPIHGDIAQSVVGRAISRKNKV